MPPKAKGGRGRGRGAARGAVRQPGAVLLSSGKVVTAQQKAKEEEKRLKEYVSTRTWPQVRSGEPRSSLQE